MVASRSEVMLPPAGSEARWREEVMLALTHQEAKTKEKEQANQSNLIRTNLFCHPEVLLFRIRAFGEPWLGLAGSGFVRAKELVGR